MLWKRLAAVVVGLSLGLVAAEVAVRALGAAPDIVAVDAGRLRLSSNRRIAYLPHPEFDWEGRRLEPEQIGVKRNRRGYRTPEIPLEKPDGRRRIVVIGDSIAEGTGVRKDEEVFVRQVEAGLRGEGVPVDVVNLSVVAYTTLQEVETLRTVGLDYEPDLVLVSYCLNDPDGYYVHALAPLFEKAKEESSTAVLRDETELPLLRRSALFRFLAYDVFRPPAADELAALDFGDYPQGNTVPQAFRELGELSREHGFEVLVVTFPFFDHTDPLFETYTHQPKHDYVRALSKREGFDHLDLFDAFRSCNAREGRTLAGDFFHPSPEGHTCAAEAVLAHLREPESAAASAL